MSTRNTPAVLDRRELAHYDATCRALAECASVDEVKNIHDKAVAIWAYAKQAQNTALKADAERVIWRAVERGGQLLAEMKANDQRHDGRNLGCENGTPTLADLGVTKKFSSVAQQVAALPEAEKARAFARPDPDRAMKQVLSKTRRTVRHKNIAAKAKAIEGPFGPFPLIYADPPWRFDTYSEHGLERAPDRHYPTMSDDEIAGLTIGGRIMAEITAKDAALFLWCTSSNIFRAGEVMRAWGFEYKTQIIWVKTKDDGGIWTGTGLVVRNAHELLLYGTRGSMPGPEYQPPSVFILPRGKHSAKPPEIRQAIERMYPSFDASSRIELFARGKVPGWSTHGNEAAVRADG